MVIEYPEWMDEHGISMFKSKYSFNNETVRGAFTRIADTLSRFAPEYKQKFFDIMWSGKLAPSTPVYLNTGAINANGKLRGHSVSCSGGYIGDSISEYYQSFAEEAKLSQLGYGCSYYVGGVRPRGTLISSTGAQADGQVPVIEMLQHVASQVTQGENRRGSVASYIEFSSNDFLEAMNYLFDNQGVANIGVNIRDSDIELLKNGDIEALDKLAELIFLKKRIGKPYIILPDNANRLAPLGIKQSGLPILGSNLCTEIMLPNSIDYTFSCVLSSLNLANWDQITDDDIDTAIVFLDCVVELTLEQTKDIPELHRLHAFTKDFRALGLGTLGWHTYLQNRMIPYDSFEATMLIKDIHSRIARVSNSTSERLGKELGIPKFGGGRRNATLTAIAPNLSSAQLAGASQSIEPIIANTFSKATAAGERFIINPNLIELFTRKGITLTDELIKSINDNAGSVQHLDELTDLEKAVFKTAYEIDPLVCVMQTELRQEDVDQGISLNIFTPGDYPEDKFVELYKYIIQSKKLKSIYYNRSTKVKAPTECFKCEG